MKRRWFCRYPPFQQSAFLVAALLWAVPAALGVPGQVQTVPKPDSANFQQSAALPAPKSPKKKPSDSPVRHRPGNTANPVAVSQSRLAARQHSGSNYAKTKAYPDTKAQNFGGERMRDLERQMWALINQDRSNPATFGDTGGRTRPLNWNERLAEVARAHSRKMLEEGFFAHVDPEGRTLEMRIDQAGIPWWTAGENIAINSTVLRAETRLMNEASFQANHRYNILNTFYTDVGIGIVQGPDGSLYITQVFIQTPPHRSAVKSTP